MRLAFLAAFIVGGAPLTALAQTQILVAQGDALPGAGVVHDVFELAVGDDGRWLASLDLGPSGPFPPPRALVDSGAVLLGPGDVLPGQPGQPFTGAASLEFAPDGTPSWTAWLGEASQAVGGGLYRGLEPWIVRDQVLTGPGLPAGFVASFVFQARATAPDEAYAIVGPSTQFSGTTAIVRIQRQSDGTLAYTGAVKTGDVVAGPTPASITFFSKRRHTFAASATGRFAYHAQLSTAGDALLRGTTPFVKAFDPAPVFGLAWLPTEYSPQAMDAAGNHAFAAATTGQGEILVRNDQLVVRKGDVLPAIAPHAIANLYASGPPNSPIALISEGRIAWFARWSSPSADADQAIFLDQKPVVREGETLVGGHRVVDLMPEGWPVARPVWAASTGGTQFAARVRLDDGRLAAIRVQPEGSITPIAGCASTPYVLSSLQSTANLKPGGAVPSTNVLPVPPGATAGWLILSLWRLDVGGCGVAWPGVGELLVSVAPWDVLALVPHLLIAPNGAAFWPVAIPPLPNLAGREFFGQAIFADASAAGLTLSNGIKIRVGHP